MHPFPATHGEFRDRVQRVGEGGVSAVNVGNGEGMVFANNVVRPLLSVSSRTRLWCPATPVRSKTVRGRRRSLPI